MPNTLVKVASIGGTLSAVGCGIGLYWKFKGPVTYDEPQLISSLFEKKRIKLLVSASDSNNNPKWKKHEENLRKILREKILEAHEILQRIYELDFKGQKVLQSNFEKYVTDFKKNQKQRRFYLHSC